MTNPTFRPGDRVAFALRGKHYETSLVGTECPNGFECCLRTADEVAPGYRPLVVCLGGPAAGIRDLRHAEPPLAPGDLRPGDRVRYTYGSETYEGTLEAEGDRLRSSTPADGRAFRPYIVNFYGDGASWAGAIYDVERIEEAPRLAPSDLRPGDRVRYTFGGRPYESTLLAEGRHLRAASSNDRGSRPYVVIAGNVVPRWAYGVDDVERVEEPEAEVVEVEESSEPVMCRIPWHDGSTRLVPEGTRILDSHGDRVIARPGGFEIADEGPDVYEWSAFSDLYAREASVPLDDPEIASLAEEDLVEGEWYLCRHIESGSETVRQYRDGFLHGPAGQSVSRFRVLYRMEAAK